MQFLFLVPSVRFRQQDTKTDMSAKNLIYIYNFVFIFGLQSLTTWDSGNQLTYPVKYIGIGYDDHQAPKEDEAKETGYSVKSDKDSDVIDYPQKDTPET